MVCRREDPAFFPVPTDVLQAGDMPTSAVDIASISVLLHHGGEEGNDLDRFTCSGVGKNTFESIDRGDLP